MKKPIFCTQGSSKALFYAKKRLESWGYPVEKSLSEAVTHFLLPVPTPADAIPEICRKELTVLGGKLPPLPCQSVDLLQDPYYLQENAAITARCAVAIAKENMAVENKSVLVIGWGRIGKCLASGLRLQGAKVTVAARKEDIRLQLDRLGFEAAAPEEADPHRYDLIFNTAPAPVLDASGCKGLCIDLASVKGIEGEAVLWARGLPGKMAPEASGALIAKTALRYALEEE